MNAIEIDWNRCPEATHYTPPRAHDSFWLAVFWRLENHKPVAAWSVDGDTLRKTVSPSYTDECLSRMIARPGAWTGEGLPPVGTECEYQRTSGGNNWRAATILYVGKQRVFFRDYQGDELSRAHSEVVFRPVETAEQIKARKREEAIDEMEAAAGIHGTVFDGDPEARVWLENLYDNNYRKQVTP